ELLLSELPDAAVELQRGLPPRRHDALRNDLTCPDVDTLAVIDSAELDTGDIPFGRHRLDNHPVLRVGRIPNDTAIRLQRSEQVSRLLKHRARMRRRYRREIRVGYRSGVDECPVRRLIRRPNGLIILNRRSRRGGC